MAEQTLKKREPGHQEVEQADSTSRHSRIAATHAYKRTAIVDAAENLLHDTPNAKLTARTIAAAAGYSPGAVYSYFSTIDEIAVELVARDLSRLGRRLRTTAAKQSAQNNRGQRRAAITTLAATAITAFAEYPALNRFGHLLLDTAAHPPDTDQGRAITGRLLQVLGVFLESGTDDSTTASDKGKDTLVLAAMLLGLGLLQKSGRLELMGFTMDDLLAHHLNR